jgi:light-regulated signal transduction histidine kinase (bacteriophytochrome)
MKARTAIRRGFRVFENEVDWVSSQPFTNVDARERHELRSDIVGVLNSHIVTGSEIQLLKDLS